MTLASAAPVAAAAPTDASAVAPAVGAAAGPAADSASALLGDVLPWLGLLALLVVAGWLVILVLRRRLASDEEAQAPFTLESLRELRRSGQLTEEEFSRAREAMIASTRRALERQTREREASRDTDRQKRP